MAEYIYIPEQTVNFGSNVLLNGSYTCRNIFHQDGSGLFTLRGPSCPNQSFARYQVTFNANIAIPTGGTVDEISVAIARNGEVLGQSIAAITPAAVEQYGNVTSTSYIEVPLGCGCPDISIENSSSTSEPILVRNSNLVITRIA